MRETEEIIEDVLEDDQEEDDFDPSIPELVVGSWREALAADGVERVFLVVLVALITVVTPAMFAFMILDILGAL